MYTLGEVGKIKFTAVICGSKDTEGGETLAFGGSSEKERSDQSICMWEREREIRVESRLFELK